MARAHRPCAPKDGLRQTHAFLRSTGSEIRTFGPSKVLVTAQFEYIVSHKV
jgi:hypothetical protein